MPTCLFCKIIDGEIPGTFVHQDERAVIFLDINQAAEGHLLIVPRHHVEMWHELDGELAAHLARLSVDWAAPMLDVAGTDHYNVAVNNGAFASQEVPHLHLHLIPRHKNDGLLRYGGPPRIAERDELQATAQRIIEAAGNKKG
ncbi:MAG: HIT family protein [Anaerolineales bacterium]|nr:HIT family protein [Anaerolineales bacterium]MCB9128679.1 HIT family protein [Ardenticatenales bacterium]